MSCFIQMTECLQHLGGRVGNCPVLPGHSNSTTTNPLSKFFFLIFYIIYLLKSSWNKTMISNIKFVSVCDGSW